MKHKSKNIYNRTISLLLFMIFSFVFMNNIFFLHSHTLSDGKIIFHAHPYHKNNNDKSKENHHHASIEYLIFGQFQTFYHKEVHELLIYNLIFSEIYHNFFETVYVSDKINTLALRAPPVF